MSLSWRKGQPTVVLVLSARIFVLKCIHLGSPGALWCRRVVRGHYGKLVRIGLLLRACAAPILDERDRTTRRSNNIAVHRGTKVEKPRHLPPAASILHKNPVCGTLGCVTSSHTCGCVSDGQSTVLMIRRPERSKNTPAPCFLCVSSMRTLWTGKWTSGRVRTTACLWCWPQRSCCSTHPS